MRADKEVGPAINLSMLNVELARAESEKAVLLIKW
jgi:hypothetical protein